VARLERILEKLALAQGRLLRTADSVPSGKWKTSPGNGSWSAAEIVAHLIMVERAIIANADRIAHKTPKRVAMLKRLHLPMAFVEARLVRRKTPIPLDSGRNQEPGFECLSLAASVLGVAKYVRMVSPDCFARDSARKTNAENCDASTERCSNFAKIGHFYLPTASTGNLVLTPELNRTWPKIPVFLGFFRENVQKY
jgi:hypothetical protein